MTNHIMGRIIKSVLLLIFCISISKSQCPDLPGNTTVNGSSNTNIDFCGAMSALFEVNDPNLPTGTIDWYSSTISGFDPLTTGTLIGSSAIDSADPCDPGGCPTIEAIFIDACGPGTEALNEFMVIGSGAGFQVDDLSVYFDDSNTFTGGTSDHINVGGLCVWFDGDASLFSGCSSLISVGPGDYIPPNSAVIIQTSRFGNTIYDVSSLCGVSDCIYVLSNSCDRMIGAFSNCGAGTGFGSTRTNEISLACGCNDVLIYDILDPQFLDVCVNQGGNGMHVFPDLTYANNLCNNGPVLNSIPQYTYSADTAPFNHSFTDDECNTTQYIVGVLNSTQFNTDCCTEQITEEYAFDIACVEAELQGNAELCPGECAEISVLITGGESTYDLDLSITGLPFPFDNITLPFIGFPLDDKITICFDNGGPLIDNATFTVDVPAIAAGFSGSMVLNTISDANGCEGTINGPSISLSFNDDPDIINPGEQETCDLGDGTGIFVLSDLNNIINGGSGATVNYYSDIDGTMTIADPYITSGGTIYAQVMGTPCNSEIIEIPLIVITNGDAGLVSLFCNDPVNGLSTECNICDDGGDPGEVISLTIIFENPSLNYEYEVVWTTESGPSSTIVGSGVGMATFNFTVFENMTFAVTVVTADGDCPDMTDLGDIVVINYSLQPDLDEPQDLNECGSVVLPDITGNTVPSNAAYFTESGGMGTMYNPGDIISDNTTLFLNAGIEDCDVEYSFEITIDQEAIIDDPDDVASCGVYVLPNITGINIDNVSYFTEIDGGGSMISAGTIISTSTVLYLFDDNCGGNQPILDITISPGPIIQNNTDTIVCEMYIVEPIIGIDLSGNEAYYDTIKGNGNIINVGDTITTDSILFIYDNTGGCEVEVPVFINVQLPAFPGLDTAIIVCEGDPTLININEALGGNLPDSTGIWFDINSTGIIIDSSQVDFSTLVSGIYLFEYQIMDSICVDTHSVLTINIIGTPYAGEDASLTLCTDTTGVDVFSLLGNPDISGVFYNEMNMVAAFDPMNASFSASPIGSTLYTYIVGNPASSCGSDSAVFTIIIEENVNAGDDVSDDICAGNIVDLELLLTNNSAIGTFEEVSPSGGLMGSTFDTEEVDDGTYSILHILPGSGSCPSDTATLLLVIRDAGNAGDENEIQLCDETSISLTDYTNGDTGGQFYFNNVLLASGDVNFTNELGSFDYLYIVGDGIECPFDTAILTVVRELKPATFLDIDIINLCNDDCTTVSFNAANNGGQSITIYYHIESNMGDVFNGIQPIGDLMPDTEITYCIGIGNLSNNVIQPGTEYIFSLDSVDVDNAQCVFLDGASVIFNTLVSVENTLTGTYCLDAEVMVGGDVYDVNTPSGITILENGSQNGCDSIVNVDLIFQEVAEGTFLANLCEGESITVNSVLYTETNTTDEFIIPNGSINGCDSLVKINVFFAASTLGEFMETFCAGDTIPVNNELFYVGKEMGSQLLVGANSIGCDSIVNVDLIFLEVVEGTFLENLCEGESITVNNILYTETNTTDEFIIPNGSINGCDSLVKINVFFEASTIGEFMATICAGDTIPVNNEPFYVGKVMGSQLLVGANSVGCDSIVEVSIEVDDPVTSDYVGDFCDSYFIDINGTIYDQNKPSGIENFINQAANGCDSLVVIDLTFNAEPIDSTLNLSTCDDNFSITIGTSVFDISIPSGTADLVSNNPNACDTTVNVDIMFGELGVNYIEVDGGCTASQKGMVIIESSSGDAPFNILYNGNNTIAFTLPISIDLPVGTGEISITDDNGCETILQYELFPGGGEEFELNENQGQISVSGGDIDSIIWSPIEGLSCTDCLNPIADPAATTNYNATIFFDDSCSVDLQIEIIVIDDTPDYILPTVFSPNGDNTNENFILTITSGASGIPQNMSIYDRWGNRVYSGFGTDLTTIGWNGMVNGKNITPGVYVYQLTLLENERLVSMYGDVTVIR